MSSLLSAPFCLIFSSTDGIRQLHRSSPCLATVLPISSPLRRLVPVCPQRAHVGRWGDGGHSQKTWCFLKVRVFKKPPQMSLWMVALSNDFQAHLLPASPREDPKAEAAALSAQGLSLPSTGSFEPYHFTISSCFSDKYKSSPSHQ